MNNKEIEKLFERFEGEFDIHETPDGHQRRFLSKLNAPRKSSQTFNWWKPMAIAASFIILFGLGFNFFKGANRSAELASVSPEMEEAQTFFVTTINNEIEKLNGLNRPETKAIIEDALSQLEALENNYELLKEDLAESGDDKRVIYAMIRNFQSRISILEQVISTIEEVQNLKNINNEITI